MTFCWLRPVLVVALSLSSSFAVGLNSQNSPQNSSSTNAPRSAKQEDTGTQPDSGATKSQATKTQAPDLSPPRSDRVKADDLGADVGESSSKDTQVDLSPPEDDAKAHPKSAEALSDAEASANGGVREFHVWDPHKAAKSVEVGDFYFKRRNYRAAEDRYREALGYKDDDAVATFRLAVCLEKLDRPEDAVAEYQSYLKILPYGPQAEDSKKSIERLMAAAVSRK